MKIYYKFRLNECYKDHKSEVKTVIRKARKIKYHFRKEIK